MNVVYAANSLIKTNAMVEVSGADADPTPVPVTNPLVAGTLDCEKKRTFDLIVSGNCKTGSADSKISFEVNGEETAPDFFELKQGEIVFAEPHPVGTITMPKGHQSFVKISLQSINAENSEESQKWVCLGIRKKDAKEYLDYLYMPNKKETHIEMYSEDAMELVPLISAVDLSNAENSYVAVEPGKNIEEHVNFHNRTDEIKFSAVYRIDVQSGWLTELDCDMPYDGHAVDNLGSLGIGPIGKYTEDQMVGIETNTGTLIHSSDGKTWLADIGRVSGFSGSPSWHSAPQCSHDTWCAVSSGSISQPSASGISPTVYSKEECWKLSRDQIDAICLEYGENVFMTIGRRNGKVYTSEDAINWTNIGSVPSYEDAGLGYTALICGDNKWICGDCRGNLYQSENTGVVWSPIEGSNLSTLINSCYGGCYVNRHFYVAANTSILKSSDGRKWIKVVDGLKAPQGNFYLNVTYYKGRLYTFRNDGKKYAIGMP